MKREGRVTPEVVSEELSIPIQNARELIQQVDSRIEEDPRLADKALRGYPTLRVGADSIIVSSVDSLDRSLKYANLLRYILSNSKEIDDICPKRMEKVTVNTSIVPTTVLNIDAAVAEEYADIFGEFEETEEVEEETPEEEVPEEVKRISTKDKQQTTYNYFKSRLQKFDPVTFDPEGSQYPKICEQKHQPIILSESDKSRISGTPYDVTESFDEYDPTRASRAIEEFVGEQLSNWFVRLSRRRFWKGELNTEKRVAYDTLYTCLNEISKLMSPVAPFFSDWLYRAINAPKIATSTLVKSGNLS